MTAPAAPPLTEEALVEACAKEIAYTNALEADWLDDAARRYADEHWEDWTAYAERVIAVMLDRLVGRIDSDDDQHRALARFDRLAGTGDPYHRALLALLAERIERWEAERHG